MKWGLFWVDISASFCFTVTVLPAGLAFSQASSRPFSKSSLFSRPRKGSDRFFQAGTMSYWACFSMFFGAFGFSCQAKSSEKVYSRKAANAMPGTIRVVSGTRMACHFLWSPYLASASAANSSVGSAADTASVGLSWPGGAGDACGAGTNAVRATQAAESVAAAARRARPGRRGAMVRRAGGGGGSGSGLRVWGAKACGADP
mmetsp:Transcript_21496/g.61059  ORF Transcript_21496/g.61059 Transcript_21496/m.61059 type:complete len:202 (-) Transcript_21496:20-625(-)